MLGRNVGNYGIISKIGEGGMGIVYLARHVTLGRHAAIKVLRPALSSNQDIVSRFFNEARAATAVRNSGIVEVYDCGFLEDQTAYIVMEYLDGESLATRLRRGRGRIAWALAVVRGIARALQAAHEQGIVHRDLKPDNVFLVPDSELPSGERVKLLDFGIAKLAFAGDGAGCTSTGIVMGTPAYMAPEQCRGARSIDHRADLYSLGCVAYEMLCGHPPFVADASADLIARHLYFEPSSLRSHVPGIPIQVEDVVLRLLKKEPGERYGTTTELIRVLDAVAVAIPGGASGDAVMDDSAATHFDSRRNETVVTRSESATSDGMATLPLVTQTTLSGAASSGKSDEDEPRGRRRALAVAAVATALLVLMFFFRRTTEGEYLGSHATSVPQSTGSNESENATPSRAPSQDPMHSPVVPVPADAGPVGDAAIADGMPRKRLAGAPSEALPPAVPARSDSSSVQAAAREADDMGIVRVGAAAMEVRSTNAKDTPVPHDAGARIDVEATSSNAAPAQAPHRVQLTSTRVSQPTPPPLSCSAPATPVTLGHRLRIPCEASNPGDQPVKGVAYKVAIAHAQPAQVPGPPDLAPHAPPAKFDVDVTLPSDATPGALSVTVTASTPGGTPVVQELSIDVVEPHKLCKPGELTVEDYRRKHKLLDEDRAAGNLTKEELNDLLAELWSCVRSP